MKTRSLLASFAVVLAVAASAQTVSIPQSDDPVDFALTLYRKVATATPGANTLVSPYSAREAVGLAYLGARGDTAAGLAQALHAGSVESFMAAAKKTRRGLMVSDEKATVEVANSLWLRSDWTFLNSYTKLAKDGFGAEVFRRPFTPKTAAEAAAWVSRRTHGKIRKAVDELKPDDVAVLLNAVYFKGIWARPFDKKKTRDQDFHLAAGKVVPRPRMSFADPGRRAGGNWPTKFAYAEDDGLQAVRLPYGTGRLAMLLILPAKTASLSTLTAKLDGNWWRNLRSRLKERRGEVELPPFKFETSARLNGPFIAMGAGTAFDREHADFRDMARAEKPGDMLYISEVRQQALIEVDEEGTVAAARTSAIMAVRTAAAPRETPFSFIADRPFLFAIEDTASGTPLFIGSVQDPR